MQAMSALASSKGEPESTAICMAWRRIGTGMGFTRWGGLSVRV